MSPSSSIATAQPTTVPRCSRVSRPVGPDSSADAPAGPRRDGEQAGADVASAGQALRAGDQDAEQAPDSSSGVQRRSTKARFCWAQATGENHDSGLPPGRTTSPTPRASTAAPRTASALPVAARACSVSWALTPATAPNTAPVSPIAAATITERPSSLAIIAPRV